MNGINLSRVLIAGIAAGVVINLGEFLLWTLVLEETFAATMAAHNLAEPSWAMAAYIIGSFVLGITLAFTYAAIRPRFGPGTQAAAVAGGILWVAAWVMPMVYTGAMGIGFTMGTILLVLGWALVEVMAAAMVAGWAYQEADAPAGSHGM